jgi:hypothetical protein
VEAQQLQVPYLNLSPWQLQEVEERTSMEAQQLQVPYLNLSPVAAPGGGGEDQRGDSAAPGTVPEPISVAAPGGGGEDQHGGSTAPGTVPELFRNLLVKHGDPDPALENRQDLTPYSIMQKMHS